MFTDNPTIPAQLEVLLDLIHVTRTLKTDSDALRRMIQPNGLPDLTSSSAQVAHHVSAAKELELISVSEDKVIRLNYPVRGTHNARAAIVAAFDRIALADAQSEKWAGRYYAYLISRDDETVAGDALVDRFMAELPSTIDKGNPLNPDKHRALQRWYPYVGLGWVDPGGSFVPDPTHRLLRQLPSIWGEDNELDAELFMTRVAQACPELDSGALFTEVTNGLYSAVTRLCTPALATALRRLHEDGNLQLHCPADSRGWSLEKGGRSAVTGEASNRFDKVARVSKNKANA